MKMIKSKETNFFNGVDVESTWKSSDDLNNLLVIEIWKLGKKTMERSKYRLGFKWFIRSSSNGIQAYGYSTNLKKAIDKASSARSRILNHCLSSYKAPERFTESLEELVAI